MNKLFLKKVMQWSGNLLSLLGIVFVTLKLIHYHHQLKLNIFSPSVCFLLIGMTLSYGMATVLLPIGWQKLLQYLNVNVSVKWSIKAYGISQLAKYIPGNIFHLVSRQVISAKSNIPPLAVAKSSLWELKIIILTALIFGLLVWPLPKIIPPDFIFLTFLTLIFTLIFSIYFYINKNLGMVFLSFSLFHALSGTIFSTILLFIYPNPNLVTLIPYLIGAYVIAWLVGLIIPGAPAGVGIREIILFSFLHFHVPQIDLLKAITFGRMVTVGGDMLLYSFALSTNFLKKGKV